MASSARVKASLVGRVAVVSLILLFALRVWAAFYSVHARTPWDDTYYRQAAVAAAEETPLHSAAAGVLLPNSDVVLERTAGYHSWLVLSLTAFEAAGVYRTPGATETAFHIANVLLLALQLVALFWLARWGLGSTAVALALVFVYFSAPVVFGINRWVVTDNHILTTLWVVSCVVCWLAVAPAGGDSARAASESSNVNSRGVVPAMLGAYAMGVFATVREYAAPIFLTLLAVGFLGLWLRHRRLAALAYAGVLAPFLFAMVRPLQATLAAFQNKSKVGSHFHPLSEMLPHLWWHGYGPVLVVVGVAAIGTILWFWGRQIRRPATATRQRTGLVLLLAAYCGLTALYVVGLATSRVRVVRPTLLPMVTALCALIVASRLLPRARAALTGARARGVLVAGMATAWLVLGYQLVYAFDGGKRYLFPGHALEVWNHPVDIRALEDPGDSHAPQTRYEKARRQEEKRALRQQLRENLDRLRRQPDPKTRKHLAQTIAYDPRIDQRFLDDPNVVVVGTDWDLWTYGVVPAGIVVKNPTWRAVEPRLRLATWARASDYPITVQLEDGEQTSRYRFTGPGEHLVQLAPVPARSDRLYILWSKKGWQSRNRKRTLGVKILSASRPAESAQARATGR